VSASTVLDRSSNNQEIDVIGFGEAGFASKRLVHMGLYGREVELNCGIKTFSLAFHINTPSFRVLI
jgi:hypothetical protein|tara:strand:+ start:451 stop:648 length:198 start_codon:yes stop_codon:yes gene_type:complete